MTYHNQKEGKNLHYRHWWTIGTVHITLEHLFWRDGGAIELEHDEELGWGISLRLPGLFSVWLHVEGLLPRLRGLNVNKELSLRYHNGTIWWTVWLDPMGEMGSRRIPKWRNGSIGVVDALRGPVKYSTRPLSFGSCEVILPEYRYPAEYEVIEQTWGYPRWFTRQQTSITVKVPEGIPIPGKGESAHDCGDDKVFTVSSAIDWNNEKASVRGALQDLAMTILKRRMQYASLDWKPRDEDVENIVDAYEKHGKSPVCGATDHALGVEKKTS